MPSHEPPLPAFPMSPHETTRFKLRPDQLVTRITPAEHIYVLAHFGIPQIDVANWRLEVGGLVARPLSLSLDDIKRFPKVEIESFIKCAGFPHDNTINTRAVSNAVWGGARLADVLDAAGLSGEARYLWALAPDHGTYARWSAPRYAKDLTVERGRAGDVLLAYEVNGGALPVAHGFPLRLFVPGYYGTNSVKWLCRIEAADARVPHVFTTELYNDPAGDGTTAPVWQAAPEALIVEPADHGEIAAGDIDVWGWCWGADAIVAVDVSLDGGKTWRAARVAPRRQWEWQSFEVECELPPGQHVIMARARDAAGRVQPERAARNAIHSIGVTAD
ncbi:molybdopterin-dependent oxidoreductase [Pseudolabrys sp.]|uniref:molybdopterin-dependent oxidoreductase n=1 Tax=Pseudolabrys sp. TaxID=1960880 RepID=UPI003D0B2180